MMSQFYLKQRVFSIVDNYVVYDGAQTPLYQIQGQFLSLPKRHEITNARTGELLYTLKRPLLSLLPRFELIDAAGDQVATIQKMLSLFVSRIEISSNFGEYTVRGDVFAHDFQIEKEGLVIVEVHKKWLSWGDVYEIAIEDNQNQEFLLAMVVAIDQAMHENRGSSGAHH
jgi:uncharacterized protein YxjI